MRKFVTSLLIGTVRVGDSRPICFKHSLDSFLNILRFETEEMNSMTIVRKWSQALRIEDAVVFHVVAIDVVALRCD